jgi:hypothetical protein
MKSMANTISLSQDTLIKPNILQMGFVANKQAHVLDAVHWYVYPGMYPVLRQPVHDTALPQPTHYQTCPGVRALTLTLFEAIIY